MDFTRRETLALLSSLAASPTLAGENMPTVVNGVTPQANDGVFLVCGQSEMGFSGNVATTNPASGALFFDLTGTFYTCADYLPGASIAGAGGSIWSRLAHLYNTSSYKPWSRLIFVMVPVPGSASIMWTPGHPYFLGNATPAFAAMVGRGFTPSAYLWGNGSKDNVDIAAGTRAAGEHLTNFTAMKNGLRTTHGITTPIIQARCCLARINSAGTFLGTDFDTCSQGDRLLRLSAEFQIQKEQAEIARAFTSQAVYDGPNMDAVSCSHRYDGIHMDDYGQWLAALMWLDILLRYKQAGLIA